ncbi:glycoside hydrolase family 92 protein [Puteibacter caeruleilacunae]|nr:glycoside hydrolase family 92 protein [Puteibacter caeruleilacunae]
MRQIIVLFVFVMHGLFTLAQSPVDYVNPFIGSSNYGTTNPGAIVPQGMVSVVPFNVTGSKENTFDKDARWWSTPYAWENKYLTGFTHVNLSGVGCPDLGSILLMPVTGEINADEHEYGSIIKDQKAKPGYYSTILEKYGVKAEMTATQRAGFSKYTFSKGDASILLNLGVGLTNETGAMIKIVNNQEIEGYRMTGNFCYNPGSERPVYFVARFNKPAKEYGVWKKMPKMTAEHSWSKSSGTFKYYKGYTQEMIGDSIGAWFSFGELSNEEVLVKVGVSYVSIENARQNLNAEINHFDFNKTKTEARAAWDEALSRLFVEGGTDDQKTVFYSALYHMQIHPNVINDVNGQYPVMDGYEVKELEDGNRYTVFSLWDTYRNFHPLMALVYPEQQLDMVRSMIEMYKESGWLPKWELNSKETHVMEGDPSIPVIVDTYLRGLTDFDVESAYAAMVKSATTEGAKNKLRPDIDEYLSDGYVPMKSQYDNSVSHALEYYIADWNLGQFAKVLNKPEDATRFNNQSLRYKEYFDKEFMMIRPKMPDGTFYKDFDPRQGENFAPSPGFHEGNAWQYTFYVPHDIKGLTKLMGGKKKFVAKLQKVFDEGHFDMANEPDINYPYFFNFFKGEEWRAQKEVRNLIDTYYKNAPGGIPGNDDCGTLSAWIVYSMMGFYPYCAGDMNYAITSPVFDKITIKLDKNFYPGSELVIEADREGKGTYIKSMELNGKPVKSYFMTHDQMVKGGTLKFKLSDQK